MLNKLLRRIGPCLGAKFPNRFRQAPVQNPHGLTVLASFRWLWVLISKSRVWNTLRESPFAFRDAVDPAQSVRYTFRSLPAPRFWCKTARICVSKLIEIGECATGYYQCKLNPKWSCNKSPSTFESVWIRRAMFINLNPKWSCNNSINLRAHLNLCSVYQCKLNPKWDCIQCFMFFLKWTDFRPQKNSLPLPLRGGVPLVIFAPQALFENWDKSSSGSGK